MKEVECLIGWYESGIKGETPIMPGDGFSTWDYTAIAQLSSPGGQSQVFHQLVLQLLDIVGKEYRAGNLDRVGVWPWCSLQSGKQWPFSKQS